MPFSVGGLNNLEALTLICIYVQSSLWSHAFLCIYLVAFDSFPLLLLMYMLSRNSDYPGHVHCLFRALINKRIG
jgi:hypothetical protein